MRIIQGTTPTLTINIENDIPISEAEAIELTFKNGTSTLIKGLSDVTIDEKKISYHFTEAETLAFAPESTLYWQFRIKIGNDIYGIPVQQMKVSDLLSEEVMA